MHNTRILPKLVAKKLKCSICDSFLNVSPILITSLDGNQYKCGRCHFVQTDLNVPAVMFEMLASVMRFPCIHPNCGVREIPWTNVESHEKSCGHQPMKCFCGKTVPIQKIDKHFEQFHGDMIREDRVIVHPKDSQLYTRLIIQNRMPFLVYIFYEKETDIQVGVYNSRNTLDSYEFMLQILSNSNMSIINIPNQKIPKYNSRNHCSDCLLRKCSLIYHKYQNSIRIDTSSVYNTLGSDEFILTIKVIERNTTVRAKYSYIKNRLIRKSWECQICQNYFRGHIFLCPGGHSVCEMCKSKVTICPYCKREMGDTRNYMLEEIAKHMQLTCQYEERGCNFFGNMENIHQHEQNCDKKDL